MEKYNAAALQGWRVLRVTPRLYALRGVRHAQGLLWGLMSLFWMKRNALGSH